MPLKVNLKLNSNCHTGDCITKVPKSIHTPYKTLEEMKLYLG